jgi:Fe-Mn family superoxide dismutase
MDFTDMLKLHEVLHGHASQQSAEETRTADCNHMLYFQGQQTHNTSFDRVQGFLGDEDRFWTEFKRVALSDDCKSHLAPGWTFLTLTDSGSIAIHRELDNRTPLTNASIRGFPLLACDLWEHAYYLKYQTDIPAYLEAWRSHIDWDKVASTYQSLTASARL